MEKVKFYTMVLWACIALGGVNLSLSAQENLFPQGITAIEDSMFIGREDLKEVVIPEGVTSIGKGAFASCKNLTSVKLPTTLTSIGSWAFCYCENLGSVELPASLTTIDYQAFWGCQKITSVTLPENLEKIGVNAFVSCSFSEQQELVIPDKVTEIGFAAFGWAPFTRVTLGKSVATLQDAFQYCLQLEAYDVHPENPNFSVVDGVLFTKGKEKLVHYPASRPNTSYRLPDETTGMSGNFPFYQAANLEVIDINRVTTVEEYVDYVTGAAPTESTIFVICNKLSEIKVAENNPAFSSVDGVLYNKKQDRLEAYPGGNKRKAYTILDGVTDIRYGAFNWGQYLTSVTIPASMKRIAEDVFINSYPLQEIHMKGMTPPKLDKGLGTLLVDDGTIEFEGDIYVPEGALSAYRSADAWSKYASQFKEEAKAFEPEVLEATDSTLSISWEPVKEATGYILDIYRDAKKEDLAVSYSFDANGQILKSTSFSYLLEDLDAGTTYYIETKAIKQSGNQTTVLASYTIEAKTTGIATANENIAADKPSVFAGNGQIIVRTTTETFVCIYDLSGHCVFSEKVNGERVYNLHKGLYIVAAGKERCKVIVR